MSIHQPHTHQHDDDEAFEPQVFETRLSSFSRAILWMALLAAIAIITHLPSLHGRPRATDSAALRDAPFSAYLDRDDDQVRDNPALISWRGLKSIWRYPHQALIFSPVTYTVYEVEAQIWGTKGRGSPAGFRVVNILLHAAAVVLLYHLLNRLDVRGAFVAAAIFAVHPASAATVGWISERQAILGTVFFVSTLLVLLRILGINAAPTQQHRFLRLPASLVWRWVIVAVLALLTTFTSPGLAAMIAPAAMVILWWKRGRFGRADMVRLAPLLALSLVILSAALVLAARRQPAWSPMALEDVPLWKRPAVAVVQLAFYAGATVYPYHQFAYESFSLGRPLIAAIVVFVAAIAAAVWAKKRFGRGFAAAMMLFVFLLFPSIFWPDANARLYGGWVGVQRLYPASIVLIAVVVALVATPATWNVFGRRVRLSDPVLTTVGSVCIVALFVAGAMRSFAYGAQERLWADTIRKQPQNASARVAMGKIALEKKDYSAAENHIRAALLARPGEASYLVHLGNLYIARQPPNANVARNIFIEVLAKLPEDFEAQVGLAHAQQLLNDSVGALQSYRKAIKLRPDDALVYSDLGMLHFERGELDEAEKSFRRALEIDPRKTAARINLAILLQKKGDTPGATEELVRTLQIDPGSYEAHVNAGSIFAQNRRYKEAAMFYRRAVSLKEDSPEAFGNLGSALFARASEPGVAANDRLGLLGEATYCFERACALAPSNEYYAQMLQTTRRMRGQSP